MIAFNHKTIPTLLFLSASLLAFGAAEEKALTVKMSEVAAALQAKTSDNVKIEARQDTLVITVNESEKKGGFNGTYSFHSLKPLAGHSFTFMIDVKLEKNDQGGAALPNNIGQIHFGEARQFISSRYEDWHTYVFKGVRIPGNGLLKMRISVKNITGEIHIRNPRIRGNFPKARDGNAGKKKKKKKNK